MIGVLFEKKHHNADVGMKWHHDTKLTEEE